MLDACSFSTCEECVMSKVNSYFSMCHAWCTGVHRRAAQLMFHSHKLALAVL